VLHVVEEIIYIQVETIKQSQARGHGRGILGGHHPNSKHYGKARRHVSIEEERQLVLVVEGVSLHSLRGGCQASAFHAVVFPLIGVPL
jgi:hypothetical protein